MKKIKLLFYVLVVISVLIVYYFAKDRRLNYIALGDSVANGENPYNTIDYSYTDYIADYLRNNNILKVYINEFTENEMDIDRLLLEVSNDKQIKEDNKKINLKKELRESDIVTISIGQNQINSKLQVYFDDKTPLIDLNKMKSLLIEIKKYAKNKVILIGYYTPILNEESDSKIAKKRIKELNNKVKSLCYENDIVFIDIFDEISLNSKYFPNPKSMNMNIFGQNEIYKKIIKTIKII